MINPPPQPNKGLAALAEKLRAGDRLRRYREHLLNTTASHIGQAASMPNAVHNAGILIQFRQVISDNDRLKDFFS